MTSMVAQPAIRLPVPTLAAGALAPGIVVGSGLAAFWWMRSAEAGQAATIGAGIALLAALVWVGAMAFLPRRNAAKWSLVLVLSSSARMLGSLAFALGLFLALPMQKAPYWGTFLACSLTILAVETIVSYSALKRAAHAAGTEDSAR